MGWAVNRIEPARVSSRLKVFWPARCEPQSDRSSQRSSVSVGPFSSRRHPHSPQARICSTMSRKARRVTLSPVQLRAGEPRCCSVIKRGKSASLLHNSSTLWEEHKIGGDDFHEHWDEQEKQQARIGAAAQWKIGTTESFSRSA
jgi:hypothetical protein